MRTERTLNSLQMSAMTLKIGSSVMELLQEIVALIKYEVFKPGRLPHLVNMDSGFLLQTQRDCLMDG